MHKYNVIVNGLCFSSTLILNDILHFTMIGVNEHHRSKARDTSIETPQIFKQYISTVFIISMIEITYVVICNLQLPHARSSEINRSSFFSLLYISISLLFILYSHCTTSKNDIQCCKLVTFIFFNSLQQRRVTFSFFSFLLSESVHAV